MSKIINVVLETAKDLNLNSLTLREIESLHLEKIKELAPAQIKKMRIREKISQSVMARVLNVTPSTYQKWERGEVCPKGANLKLLHLVYKHGVSYVIV